MSKRTRYKQYQALIDRLGMTQVAASNFLDIGTRTSRRWAAGKNEHTKVPLPVIMLLAVMAEQGLDPRTVRKLAGEPLR